MHSVLLLYTTRRIIFLQIDIIHSDLIQPKSMVGINVSHTA